jgi:hypothetical protein
VFCRQNQCAIVPIACTVETAFRFNVDALRIGAAWQYGGPEQIALFRAAVAADESGRTLGELVSSLAADGYDIRGDVMKQIPHGYLRPTTRAPTC